MYLHFGTVAANGTYSETANITVVNPMPNNALFDLMVNPANDTVYVFCSGEPPQVYKASDRYNALSSGSTFNLLPTSGIGNYHYSAFGFGPDGRLFMGTLNGNDPNANKLLAYTDDDGAVWDTVDTGLRGALGPNIPTAGTTSPYYVYFGTILSDDSGESNWKGIGDGSFETHPNDGMVMADPIDNSVIYTTTDQGIGASENYDVDIFEIDDGVVAVQVNDFAMDTSKTIAWSASKSGVRQVVDYGLPTEAWSMTFPQGDGSPFHSIAMDLTDLTGNTAFAGNVRIYKTDNCGSHRT